MKKRFFSILLSFMMTACICQVPKLQDGIYLVDSFITDSASGSKTKAGLVPVHFNKMFLNQAPAGVIGLIVKSDNFVPLELDEDPLITDHADAKKKLSLSFNQVAADKLAAITASNVMKQAAMVVNDEALIVHKIRATITGGKMEITGSDDDACEHLYVTLKKNVKIKK